MEYVVILLLVPVFFIWHRTSVYYMQKRIDSFEEILAVKDILIKAQDVEIKAQYSLIKQLRNIEELTEEK